MKPNYFYIIIALYTLISISSSFPASPSQKFPQHDRLMRREAKKDLFVSRGWAAGGMPFSVLYMTPYSSKTPHAPETPPRIKEVTKEIAPKKPQKTMTYSKPRSVIPQLFVSYGWGPLGKK